MTLRFFLYFSAFYDFLRRIHIGFILHQIYFIIIIIFIGSVQVFHISINFLFFLKSEWQQISLALQDSSKYSC